MSSPDNIELHDAIIKTMQMDYLARSVKIGLDYYAHPDDATRAPVWIVFDGVISMSHLSDFNRLEQHAWAGNVNYWRPGTDGTASYLYLSDGCIAITAEKISLLPA